MASLATGALVLPATAAAHVRTGRVAVDYVGSVAPLRPPLAGAVTVRIYKADLALGVTLQGRHGVVVLGYSGEPFLRFGPDGVYANRSSLTAAGLGPVTRGSGWRLLSREPRLIWHAARVRGLPAGARRGRWAVRVLVEGTRSDLTGELRRERRPPVWPWLAIGAAFAVATGLLLAAWRPDALRTAAAGLGWLAALATLLVTCGFAVKSLPVLLHGVVLSALPADLARTADVLAISAGAAAAVVGLVVFFDVLEHYEEPASVERYL